MKKSFLTIISVAAIMIAALTINSCTKQDELNQKQESVTPEKDYTIYNTLSSFTTQMNYYKENPQLKDGEEVEVDSCLWLIEGAINLTYGFPFEEYIEFVASEDSLVLVKNPDGRISMDEVALKYQELIEKARTMYYGSGVENKGLYIVNLEKSSENSDNVTFSVETITGSKGIDPYPFLPGDNWWYGDLVGGCSGNNQTGSDAAHELAGMYPTYPMTECTGISSSVTVDVVGGDLWLLRPGPINNSYDYYIFCVNDDVEPFDYENDLCLLDYEMGTYYGYLDYVITDLARGHYSIPQSLNFIDFTFVIGKPVDSTKYIHEFTLLYGKPFLKKDCNPAQEL